MTAGLVPFPLDRLNEMPAEAGAPSPERLMQGAPTFKTWTLNESADGKTFAGIWEATPGAWRVVYDEWEYCAILSGVSELVSDGEAPRRLQGGDHIVIEPGFVGIWRVIETTRKTFVVRLP
jgi:uncharacterized cupin superfamily protein